MAPRIVSWSGRFLRRGVSKPSSVRTNRGILLCSNALSPVAALCHPVLRGKATLERPDISTKRPKVASPDNKMGNIGQKGEPPLRVVDFAEKGATRLVATALRRLWLVSPPPIPEQVKDPLSRQKKDFDVAFKSCIDYIIGSTSPHNAYDDALWRQSTRYKLLEVPGATTDSVLQDEPLLEWRNHILSIYSHVFADFAKAIAATEEEVGELQGADLEAITPQDIEFPTKEHPEPRTLKYTSNTFLYPAYVAPDTKITVTVDNTTHTWLSDGRTCTVGLWIKSGKEMSVIVERDGAVSSEDQEALAATLIVGHCSSREHPPPPPGEIIFDPNSPEKAVEMAPEANHLARAIWLRGGDAVENPSFDEVYEPVDEEAISAALECSASPPEALYSPLPDDRAIRLLVIEPGASGDDLRTRLQVVSLRDAPRYEALSYTWGAHGDKVELACSSTWVPVPRNLVTALKRLRLPDKPRHVWADAICINQEDLPERGQQVSIMRHIFHTASRVVVWVGEDASGCAAAAFKTICTIVRAWTPPGEKLRYASYDLAFESMPAGELEALQRSVSAEDWKALQVFFESIYFRRFWVIQELALSQSAVVTWGDHHIAWPLVGICAAWLLTKGWNFRVEAPITAAYNAFMIYVLPIAQNSSISVFSKLDFSVALGMTVDIFDSTDPRDRIYALLGMPFAGNDPTSTLLVKPEYTESVLSVYTRATRRILEQDRHLRILSSVQHGSEISPDGPSWVPRWNEPYSAEPLALRAEQGYYANGGELFCPDEETFGADGQSLSLVGLECTRVSEICEPFEKGNIRITSLERQKDRDSMTQLLGVFLNPEKQVRSSWSSKADQATLCGYVHPEAQTKDAFPQEVVATSIPGKYGMRASVEMITAEKAQRDNLGEFILYWRERCGWRADEIVHDHHLEHLKTVNPLSIKMELTLCAYNTFWGRRIFYCEDGRVGLGPAASRPGDVIAVLFGGIVPYILRPQSDGGWLFVGECFVPSLMQGEAVEAAGVLKTGEFERDDDGSLTLDLDSAEEGGPRFHRKVGENNIKRFRII